MMTNEILPLDNLLEAYGDLLKRLQIAESQLSAIRVIVGAETDETTVEAVRTVTQELLYWEQQIPSMMDQLTRGSFDLAKMRGERDEAQTELAAARAHADALARENARLAPVIAWIKQHHAPFTDSDVVDVDHGPIVEWTVCSWCSDHFEEGEADWPCMFAAAAGAVPEPGSGER